MNSESIRAFMDAAGMRASKKLGQHFLLDERIVERQIAFAGVTGDDDVLEIGPGFGVLTEKLAEKANKVIAIETDKRLAEYLNERMPENVQLLVGDALSLSFPPFNKIVSNLPYSISSPITFKFLGYDFDVAVLMYQEEFARRLCAAVNSPDYSRLTVHAYFKADCEIVARVPKNAFWPQPKITSALVRITPLPHGARRFAVRDEAFFLSVTKALFEHRRKTIKRSLLAFFEPMFASPEEKEKMKSILEQSTSANQRVETLTPEDIGSLSDMLYDALDERTKNRAKT
jgi:16S rRNA (adenine1518-N6/adenine1519-N6)-dimethyltransferase